LRVDSRCVLISIQTLLRSPYPCLASRPRKLPRFGPNVSPSANDPILPSRSSVSRSAARRRPTTSGNANSLLRLKQPPFCVCKHRVPPRTRSRSYSPKQARGLREQPLTTHHLPHMSPSGPLEVLGVRLSPAAYALMAVLVSPSGLKPNSRSRLEV
jgi:hypothetical protein